MKAHRVHLYYKLWLLLSVMHNTLVMVYFSWMLFVFPYVLMWCSFAVNLLVVTLQKKLRSGSHKVPLTKNRTVGGITTSRLWGRTSLLLPPGAENLSYATDSVDKTAEVTVDTERAILYGSGRTSGRRGPAHRRSFSNWAQGVSGLVVRHSLYQTKVKTDDNSLWATRAPAAWSSI